jgi:hypothetical protein
MIRPNASEEGVREGVEQGVGASASPTALSSPTAIEPASQSRPSGLQSAGAIDPETTEALLWLFTAAPGAGRAK